MTQIPSSDFTRRHYYRALEDGTVQECGPFPATGAWVAYYAEKGFYLSREEAEQAGAQTEVSLTVLELANAAEIDTAGKTEPELVDAIKAVLRRARDVDGIPYNREASIEELRRFDIGDLRELAALDYGTARVKNLNKGQLIELIVGAG